jgi:hypothetical protein
MVSLTAPAEEKTGCPQEICHRTPFPSNGSEHWRYIQYLWTKFIMLSLLISIHHIPKFYWLIIPCYTISSQIIIPLYIPFDIHDITIDWSLSQKKHSFFLLFIPSLNVVAWLYHQSHKICIKQTPSKSCYL